MPQSILANANQYGIKDGEILKDLFTRMIEIIEQEDHISEKNMGHIMSTYKNMKELCESYDNTHIPLQGVPSDVIDLTKD